MQSYREFNAERLVADDKIIHLDDLEYLVQSQRQDGVYYSVSLSNGSCSCPDYLYRRQICKHLIAVKRSERA